MVSHRSDGQRKDGRGAGAGGPGCGPRSSRSIRWPCTAGWTSVPAKPTPEERARAPHHLIDILEPHEEFSLAQYIEAAQACAAGIRARSRQVLLVGGTPLYLKGLLRGIFSGPPADWQFRERLADEAAREEPGFLHRRLAQLDPEAAARLHPNDTRRLIRALEVAEKTGQPISAQQQQFDRARPAEACRVFVLDWPREGPLPADQRPGGRDVRRRPGRRSPTGDFSSERPLSRTANQAVGYRETIEYLAGRRSLAEDHRAGQDAHPAVRQATRHLVPQFERVAE